MSSPATSVANERSHGPDPGSFEIVAMASSAGGLHALGQVLSDLPADFVPVVVVQHLSPRHRSLTAEILDRCTVLQVRQVQEGDRVARGVVHIAPPDHHLVVGRGGSLTLTQTELVHFVRPSADLLFESVAATYGARAIAVVLTGSGSDGQTGVRAIKKMGGVVIAQNRSSSEFFGMPCAAIDTGVVDWVLPLEDIAWALVSLVTRGKER